MQVKAMALEDAIIELGKVQSLLRLINESITARPTVKDIQNAYFIIDEMFNAKYEALKEAYYGEDKTNE